LDFRIASKKVSCALHSKQLGPLRVAFRKLKTNLDVYRFWGGEIVVSERFISLVHQGECSGAKFLPIVDAKDDYVTSPFEFSNSQNKVSIEGKANPGRRRNLAQLTFESKPIVVSQGSQFGETPFDKDNKDYHRCDAGVIAGRRLISTLSVLRSSWDGSDLCRTDVYVGGQRQGLFRPQQLIVVSKRLFQAMRKQEIKGIQFEVADVVL